MGFGDITAVKKNTGGFGSVTPTSNSVSGGFGGSVSSGDLQTSQGLYSLATQNGLQKQADDIMASQQGEKTKEIFSGGFISDTFDVLNSLQYGVVGMLKGKSFLEGVKTRQSFSDQDALGEKGLPGVIGGIALDIAFDPLTYIAPATVIRKIPFATKLLKGAKEMVFGKYVEKAIEGTGNTYQAVEGGTALGKYLASKVNYMQGADPVFRETFERGVKNIAVEAQVLADMGKSIARIEPETAAKLLTKDETGRFIRTPLKGLTGILNTDELDIVTKFYSKIDDLGKQAVALGLLGKEKYEENLGEYIKNAYTEYELAKGKKIFGSKKVGIKGIKGRVEGLTPEMMKDLGQIDNPAYLLFKSAFDMTKDIQNGLLFKEVSQKFGTNVMQEGFAQIPKTGKFVASQGKQAEILGGVKKINTDLKPMFANLKATFKADKNVMSEITRAEKQFEKLGKLQGEELYKFFNDPTDITKTVETGRKLGIIPEKLQPLANSIKKFEDFTTLQKSKEGIELEKLFINGDLERNGFRSMEEFFEIVKNPYKAGSIDEVTKFAKGTPEFDASVKARQTGSDLQKGTGVGGKTPIQPSIKKNIFGEVQPVKVTIKELDLLKQKIQNLNKGFKAGVAVAKKEIGNAQSDLIKIIKNNFPKEEQGAFLTKVKNATNPEKLGEAVDFLKGKFDDMLTKADDLGASKQIGKVVSLQKEIEQLLSKSKTLSEIDKRSIDDAFRMLEKNINEARFTKEDLLQNLQDAKLGDLAGKYVPQHMYDYLNEIIAPSAQTVGKQLVAAFKFAKVIMNPATHARNIISNKMLNYFKLGMNPLDPKVIMSDLEAAKEIKKGTGKWTELARPHGYNVDTFASAEMKGLLDSPEVSAWGKGNKLWGATKKKLGDIYQAEENFAKLSAFIYNSKKGFGPEEAWKAAESATFNYAQVTPFVRKLRESLFGFPFITFTVKSTPVIAETLVKAPHRISAIGKIKAGIENLSDITETDAERASEPPWVKDGFYIKLPIKDEITLADGTKQQRSAYFDLTYILPFGDLLAGNFFERGIDRDTGLPESQTTAMLKKSPFLNLLSELHKNKNFYGNKIWKESDSSEKQLGDLMLHLTKTITPPLIAEQISNGYNEKGIKQFKGFTGALTPQDKETQQRTFMEELLKNVGAKVQPIDADIQETYQEWNKKKAMETLLRENGIGSEFSRFYIPKK